MHRNGNAFGGGRGVGNMGVGRAKVVHDWYQFLMCQVYEMLLGQESGSRSRKVTGKG